MNTIKYTYKSDCKFFRGDIPCRPHKEFNVHCSDCKYYQKERGKILIIKLGAIGDVIRTSPLLHKIKEEYPDHSIWWLTLTPEVLPALVDKKLKFNLESVLLVRAINFEILINLDKDDFACGLAKKIKAKVKYGFTLKKGKPAPENPFAEEKFITGIFDDANKANIKSYLVEIFEICGWEFEKEEYILEKDDSFKWKIDSEGKKIVGLNTGCGSRWTSRLWKEEYWAELTRLLQENNYFPVLLGGEQENERNLSIAKSTNCLYLGHFGLNQFISLVDKCDIVVTAVTMALHIAIGLKKQVVLINNIFNPNEFELYGRGEIVMPEKECKCFFSPTCINEEYFCLDSLKPSTIFESIKRLSK